MISTKRDKTTLWIGLAIMLLATPAMLHANWDSEPKQEETPKQEQTLKPTAKEEATELYNAGLEASKKGQHATALPLFTKANKVTPGNADILNLLAYNQRKTGDIDNAIENYKKALAIRPKFPQAREYLGEAYVQAALREVKILEGYGKVAHHELEDLVESIIDAGDKLRPVEVKH